MDTLKVPHLKKRVNSMNKIKEIFPKQFCCIWKKKSNEGNCIKPYKFLWPMKNEMKTTDRDIIKCPRIIKRFDPLMYSTIISKDIRKCPFQLLILCKFFQNLLQCDPPKLGIRLEDNVEQSSRY